MGEQNPLGKTTLRDNPSLEMTYLPTYLQSSAFWWQWHRQPYNPAYHLGARGIVETQILARLFRCSER